jgi:hypothetical protein
MIEFQQDIRYQLTQRTEWLVPDYITIDYSYSTRWYGVDKDTRTAWAEEGCAWDGATMFPDFNWILESSLRHDVHLWLLAAGAIHEKYNDAIDKALAADVKKLGGPEGRGKLKDKLTSFRAWYVRKGTNLANTKQGEVRPVYRLNHGVKTRIR